jgi:hypothetical protein
VRGSRTSATLRLKFNGFRTRLEAEPRMSR